MFYSIERKKLHSVIKENRKFKFPLHITLEGNEKLNIKQNRLLKKIWKRHGQKETIAWKISTKGIKWWWSYSSDTTNDLAAQIWRKKGDSHWQHRIKLFEKECTNQKNWGSLQIQIMYKQRRDFIPHEIRMLNKSKHKCLLIHDQVASYIHWTLCKHCTTLR